MLDLKTGRFVINAEKGWELHPFMTREEFMASDFFKSEHLVKRDSYDNRCVFDFRDVDIDGYKMWVSVFMEFDIHKECEYVDKIVLCSNDALDFYDRPYDSSWREAAFEVKRLHDEFLLHETGLDKACVDNRKENWFNVDWGTFNSSINLMHQPVIEITLRYRNLTEEDKKELENVDIY